MGIEKIGKDRGSQRQLLARRIVEGQPDLRRGPIGKHFDQTPGLEIGLDDEVRQQRDALPVQDQPRQKITVIDAQSGLGPVAPSTLAPGPVPDLVAQIVAVAKAIVAARSSGCCGVPRAHK